MARWSSRQDKEEGVRFSRSLQALLFIVAAALIAFDRPADRSDGLSGFRSGFTDIAAPVLDIAAQPIRAIKNIGPYFRLQSDLAAENEQLRQELVEARYWSDLARRLGDRLEVYEEAFELETEAGGERIGAWTVADPQGAFVRSRLIAAGRAQGVREGHPVINVYGLVGRVVEAGDRSSRVLLLTDLNSRIPVMADRTNARAVMTGDNSSYPRLDYLVRDAELTPGERIVTSGDDGVLPRGVPVGEAVPTRDGGWRVRLYSDQAPVDFVWVWPFEPVAAPARDAEPDPLPAIPAEALPGAAIADGETGGDAAAPPGEIAAAETDAETEVGTGPDGEGN